MRARPKSSTARYARVPYFDIGKKVGYAVIKGPEDPAKAKAMIDALPTLKAIVMLRVSEMEAAIREGERAGD